MKDTILRGLIKVCPDPGCEAVWHNIPKSHTKCNNCGGRVMLINEKTFLTKFSKHWFQYDFKTGEYFRPEANAPVACSRTLIQDKLYR